MKFVVSSLLGLISFLFTPKFRPFWWWTCLLTLTALILFLLRQMLDL
uniref:ORF171 n=1 Tax=Cyanidiococcus yangmingshanensis TaxID=2690220 RepID=A0A7G5VUH7_9RHOD|nr:ORF171 [Cyanidiococcus yangmingshanensis]QMX77344.1 ORF171 [Cyanidiococcus yangmingshanensis]UNJ15960.1 hypothetical protein [Cyanidioschyzonaceae sp. 3]WDB00348.1 ORF47 [Cyanidiococcus yangmingshanensis]